MTVPTAARGALVGGLLAATIGVAAPAGHATVPGAAARLQAAIAEQRAALRTLPRAGQSTSVGYRRSLAHVNAALSQLRAAQAALAGAARVDGPLPHGDGIQRLLGVALSADGHAAVELGHSLWLMARRLPATNTSVAQLRADLRGALKASQALAALV